MPDTADVYLNPTLLARLVNGSRWRIQRLAGQGEIAFRRGPHGVEYSLLDAKRHFGEILAPMVMAAEDGTPSSPEATPCPTT